MKKTIKRKDGFVNHVLKTTGFDKKSRCKRRFDDILKMCVGDSNSVDLYNNIPNCIHDNKLFYVNPNKRK